RRWRSPTRSPPATGATVTASSTNSSARRTIAIRWTKMATLASSNPGQTRYSTGAVVLHWLIALALGFQLALGFAMPHDERGFALFQLHKSVGVTIFALTV